MTVPVLQVLSRSYPKVKITVVSRKFFKPLFHSIPQVDFYEADVYNRHKGALGLWRLANELSSFDVDVVADLHNVIRSNMITSFLWLKGIPSVKIDKGRREKIQLTQAVGNVIKPLKSTHERYADVFRKLGFQIDLNRWEKPSPASPSEFCREIMGASAERKIGIAPFAAFSSKAYPIKQVEELIELLVSKGGYKVFLFGGGANEVEQLDRLASSFENVVNMAGKTHFEEELNCMCRLDLMVSTDSGNGHLAAIFGIPVITLWGITHPHAGFVPFQQPMENQLMADRKQFPLIPTSVYGNKAPEGYEKAIASIAPAIVFNRIQQLLS